MTSAPRPLPSPSHPSLHLPHAAAMHTHHTAHGRNLYLLLEYIIGGEFFSHLRKARYERCAQALAGP